jgi:DNA gyrase subunit A
VLETELTEIRDKYGDERKTEIEDVWEDIDDEDLIAEEDCVFTLTHNGYIKRLPTTEYNAQRRGGKGVRAMTTREEDYVETVFTASTHDNILFFTNSARFTSARATRYPGGAHRPGQQYREHPASGARRAHRHHAPRPGHRRGELHRNDDPRRHRQAHVPGELKNIRSTGIRAITLDDGDELISVRQTDGTENIFIATHDGMSICFSEEDVRPMGRNAVGVRGIRLRSGDYVVGAGVVRAGAARTCCPSRKTATASGRTLHTFEYTSAEPRRPTASRAINITDKTGPVAWT